MLRAYRASAPLEFCIPGHRGGRDVDAEVAALLGSGPFAADVTQAPDIDDLLAPSGPIREAEALAATTWGARHTHFLVNGSTGGVQAALLACSGPGDVVAAPRASHRSVVEALILSGATPRWVPCAVDAAFGFALPPSEGDWLRSVEPDPPRALVMTRPTYHGDIPAASLIARLNACGTIIVVDEAWGAHLGFSPRLPASACQIGADLVVSSAHKMLTALSGAAMLHVCGNRVDDGRVAAALRLLTTTSPWYGVLASLDGARRQMALEGRERVDRMVAVALQARSDLAAVKGIAVAGARAVPGCEGFDEVRLTISAIAAGWTGFALDAHLRQTRKVQVELADAATVVALMSPVIRPDALVEGLRALPPGPGAALEAIPVLPLPEIRMTPREAFLAPGASVDRERAVGRVAAEVICPYPPGIPTLIPGERITREALDALRETLSFGGRLQGCADPRLEAVHVVA